MLLQRVKTGINYIIAQCLGGVVGAYAAFKLLPGKFFLACLPYICAADQLVPAFLPFMLSFTSFECCQAQVPVTKQ